MKRLSLSTCALMLVCGIAQQADAQQAAPGPAAPPATQPVQPAPMPQTVPGLNRTDASPRTGTPVARPSQVVDGLESPGLVTTTLNQAPAIATQNGTPVSPAPAVVETTVETAAPVVPVGKKWLLVPPMILDMLMADTLFLAGPTGGPTGLIAGGPMLGIGGLPHLPVDEVCVLPKLCVSAHGCATIVLPEPCSTTNGAQLRGILMVGGHVQLLATEVTDAGVVTVTMPNMLLSGEFPATLLLGMNTGDVLYEQPLTLSPIVQ